MISPGDSFFWHSGVQNNVEIIVVISVTSRGTTFFAFHSNRVEVMTEPTSLIEIIALEARGNLSCWKAL